MTGIYKSDDWSVSTSEAEGLLILIRSRTSLPAAADCLIYEHLILIAWSYDATESGMPPSEGLEQMQCFEDALEISLEAKGAGVLAASITGRGSKEWRYYTYDRDKFMSNFNGGLAGHPVYPIDLQQFLDPEWGALAELLPDGA